MRAREFADLAGSADAGGRQEPVINGAATVNQRGINPVSLVTLIS